MFSGVPDGFDVCSWGVSRFRPGVAGVRHGGWGVLCYKLTNLNGRLRCASGLTDGSIMGDRDYMRADADPFRGRGFFDPVTWTPVKVLMTANIVVFVLQHFLRLGPLTTEIYNQDGMLQRIPAGGLSWEGLKDGQVWNIVTHLFVHSGFQSGGLGFMHILGNLMIIFFAGRMLQSAVPARHVYLVFFAGGILGAFFELSVNRSAYLIGASGGAIALLIAGLSIDPERRVMMIFPIPMELRMRTLRRAVFGITGALAILSLMMRFGAAPGLRGMGSVLQTAHFAHLGGALFGLFYARHLGFRDGRHSAGYFAKSRKRRERRTMAEMASAGRKGKRRRNPPKGSLVNAKIVRSRLGGDEEYDSILDKVNAHGFQSLKDEEKQILHRVSERMRRADRGKR